MMKYKFKAISSDTQVKNYDNGLLRDENSLNGSILILNTSSKINVINLFKENKLLTIEVVNEIIEEILNKEIHFDFFIKLLLSIEMKNNIFTEEIEMKGMYEATLNLWKSRFKRTISKTMDFSRPMQLNSFLLMLDKVIKDYDSNRVSSEEAKNIYKEFSDYIGESLEDFVRLYRNNDSLNPEVNYANILFNSKDIELQEFPEIFKELRKYFSNEEKDIFSPNTKYGNSSLYGLDIGNHEIDMNELFKYLIKYPNINKIKFIDNQYEKKRKLENGYENLPFDLNNYARERLDSREYEKFKDRNIEISFLNSEINIFSLNKENLFVGTLSKLSEKMQLNENAIINIENIYVPKKEIIYSHIKNEMDIVQENLFLSNLFDNRKKSEISVDIEKRPATEKVLNKYIWDNWKGQKFNIQGQKRKFIDFHLDVIPHANMGYKEPSEWEYETFKDKDQFRFNDCHRDSSFIELGEDVDFQLKRINVDRAKLNIIDMNIGSKTFIDLMSIIGKTHNDFLFSLDSRDMTQKNILWYVFADIYKTDNEIMFQNVNTINFLNIILQKFHKNFDFLNKKDFNGIDYYNFMNEIYKSEDIFKSIIELIVIQSYLGQTPVETKADKIQESIEEAKKSFSADEIKLVQEVFEEMYEIAMNDILVFQKNNQSIDNYLQSIYTLSQEKMSSPKEKDISLELSQLFKEHLQKLYAWYELNNVILYGISAKEVQEYFSSILNGENVNIDMLNYNDGKQQKYKTLDELQSQVKIIVEDSRFKEYLKYEEAYILSSDDVYYLDVKKTQKDIVSGKVENFPTEFEKMTLQQKQKTLQSLLRTNAIYCDDLSKEQREVFNALPVSEYYTKVLNSFKYSDEVYGSVVELITFFMQNKDNKLDIKDDNINNFVYYFNKIYDDVTQLLSKGKIKIADIQKCEPYILEMADTLLKGEDVEFEKIYFKYYVDMTLFADKIMIEKTDLKYLEKFENEILTLLKSSNYVEEEIITYLEKSLLEIRKNLENKNIEYFTVADSSVKPYIFYKIVSDYVNVQKRFENEAVIKTSIIMGQITDVIDKKEYSKEFEYPFRQFKPLFTQLSKKIEDKSKMFVSEIALNSIEKEISVLKNRIINRYNNRIQSVLNENFERVEEFIQKSNITGGKTSFDLITSQLQEEFITIKNNKKFYNIANKAFFINLNNNKSTVDKTIAFDALQKLAIEYKINILYGHYSSQKAESTTAGHFILQQEDSMGLEIVDSILVPEASVNDIVIVNNIQAEAKEILYRYEENGVKLSKVTLNSDMIEKNCTKISYMNYENKEPLNVEEVKI